MVTRLTAPRMSPKPGVTVRFMEVTGREFYHTRLLRTRMTPRMIRVHCKVDSKSEQMLESAMQRLGLSARAYDRIWKVSRTIADLEGMESINSNHVSEAVGYRSLDRIYWT